MERTRGICTRYLRLLVVLALLTGALAACQQVHAGAAATVAGQRVPETELAAVLESASRDRAIVPLVTGHELSFEQILLTRLIDNQLLLDLAHHLGLSVTPFSVDSVLTELTTQAGGRAALLASAAQAGIPPSGLRQAAQDNALTDAIGARLLAHASVPTATLRGLYNSEIDSFVQFDTAEILVASRSLAVSLLHRARLDPASFGRLAARYSLDTTSAARGGVLGFQGPSVLGPAYTSAVQAAGLGEIIGPVRTATGYAVVQVLGKHVVTFTQALPQLRKQALTSRYATVVTSALLAYARRVGVYVNPQFGVWDPSTGQVVPLQLHLSSPAPGPAPVAAPLGDPLDPLSQLAGS